MNTAQHRTAAAKAEKALSWIEAAEHLEAAVAKHPAHNNPRGIGAMDQRDIENMTRKAASHRRFAKSEQETAI
ncbi:hypothetical protein SAMN05444149_10874 [Pseudosulfitobacter pseudonitzschiae]|uniref:Uncharacterized protein n=1 Tax=Pseudosulfitobacter pseudonitzschiae TaxID=1402135 RepID=A0A073IWI2_9RHOB|nr:hypothetical protein [Pseudosulfitobacter pseudonitzschiae]KEJ93960.1 hypothetical protein SUH3_11855 [Pseudosulfitobacter pseudonitzschiae]SHG00869.1 hypothetical protein SAMN05444149_10874 [Pseudosulfitobacter pseudonitzschiae]